VTVSTPTAQAGWYPDPMGRYEYRYHNGVQWTADVSVGGTRFVDPAGSPSTPPLPGSQQPTFGSPRRRGMAVASFVIGLVSLLLGWVPVIAVLAAVGVVIALVFGIIGIRRASAQGGYGRGLAIAGVVLSVVAIPVCVVGFWLTGTVFREVRAFIDPGPYEVAPLECVSGNGLTVAEGRITNTSDLTRTYTIEIEFSAGDTSTEFVEVRDVLPGATADFNSEGLHTGSTCRIRQVLGPTPFDLPAKDLNAGN
jgi:hypothetical protein